MNTRTLKLRLFRARLNSAPRLAESRSLSFSTLLAAAAAIPLASQSKPPTVAKQAAGSVARYATKGGGYVDVTEQSGFYGHTEPTETHAACSGCGQSKTIEWGWSPWAHQAEQPQDHFDKGGQRSTPQAREWALDHAGSCTGPEPASTGGSVPRS